MANRFRLKRTDAYYPNKIKSTTEHLFEEYPVPRDGFEIKKKTICTRVVIEIVEHVLNVVML